MICNQCVNMLVRSKFQQSTNGIQNKWLRTYCSMLRGLISKYLPIKILKSVKICESTAVLTVKSCITHTVLVHQWDSDYQMWLEAVQICTDAYIHTYIQAWIVSRLNINSWAEQFKRTKVKLAFTDCTQLDQIMCMLRSFLFEWWGCEVASNGNKSKS